MIPQIKKILYATDLSKNSSYAFLFATDMAKRYDAKIVILHVVQSFPAYTDAYTGIGVHIEQKEQGRSSRKSKSTSRISAEKQRHKLALHAFHWYPKFSSLVAIPRKKS
jgi:nucleotide-binding universal stress UspA family protein